MVSDSYKLLSVLSVSLDIPQTQWFETPSPDAHNSDQDLTLQYLHSTLSTTKQSPAFKRVRTGGSDSDSQSPSAPTKSFSSPATATVQQTLL